MDRPTKLKIGHLDYTIKFVGADWALKSDRRGEIDYVDLGIRVLDTLSPHEMADTFIHEVIHGLIGHYDRTGDQPIPRETVSEWLGAGLVMVWRDNPDVFRWLTSLIT